MNRSSKVFLLALLTLSFGANASVFHTGKPYHAVRQEQQVRDFNGIAIGGPIKAIIKIGSTESLRFEGDQEAISRLKVEVKDGILQITPDNKWNDWGRKFNNVKITAYISAKRVNSLSMGGSGSIEVESRISSTDLSTTVGGSGSITANVDVKNLKASIGGSGHIQLQGKTDDFQATVSGSGSVKGKNLSAEDVNARIGGSGTVYITANKTIKAVISGSGSVNYSGNATVEKTVAGSGGVRKD